MFHQVIDALTEGTAYVLGLAANVVIRPNSFISVWMLTVTLLIAVLWYRHGGRKPRSWRVLRRALFPRHHLTGRSARADWVMTGLGHVLFTTTIVVSFLGLATLAASVKYSLTALTGTSHLIALPAFAAAAITTVVAFLAYEFAYWLDHWLKHHVPFLWHFHKVHHTAETLSPLTNFRLHPIDGYLFAALTGTATGLAIGLCGWLIGDAALPFEVNGGNLILIVCAYLVISLQHTHVWLPFTGRLGRWLLSPAHHQVHHSADPRHYNSNYGSVLALFDRLFGTLRVPTRASPRLRFGMNDLNHDPHSLAGLYLVPVRDALAELAPQQPAPRPGVVKQTA